MNKALFATAFLVLLVLSHAETFEKAKLRGITSKMSTEALFKSMKKSQFGKTLLSMLTLKFKTSEGQLSQLLETLDQLGSSIQSQQVADDQNYAENSESLGQAIAGQEATVADATVNLANYEEQLANNKEALSQARGQHASLEQEQEHLNGVVEHEVQVRADEKAAFEQRTGTSEALIAGLQKVQQIFANEAENADLNHVAVGEILSLLENLVTAFQASIADDAALEQAAISNFDAYVNPIRDRLQVIASDLSELDALISQLEANVAQLEERVQNEESRLQTAEELLAQYQQQLKDLTERYTSNTSTRSQQLSLLSVLTSRLTQNAEEVQNVLNNA